MAYDFQTLLSQNNDAAQRGFPSTATDCSVGNCVFPRRSASVHVPNVEKQLIYGEDILSNAPPEHTARNAGQADDNQRYLYTIFENPTGHRFALNQERLSKHLLLLGGIGSGKTNVFNFLIESLLHRRRQDDLIFIFDTKGDFYQRFYNPADGHILIGNSPQYQSQTRFWNIFGELEDPGGMFTPADEFIAKEIGKQLFKGRESSYQPFFALAAADLTAKILIDFERQAIRTGNRSALHTWNFASWIQRATVSQYMEMIQRNPDFSSAQLYFGDPSQGVNQKLTPQAQSVLATVVSMCNDLLTGVFAKKNPSGEISMRSLVRDRAAYGGKKVVFIEYDLSVGEVLSPIYRLLIDLALKEALGQNANRKGNVIFIIDEFKLLPDLMHIDDALNFGRSLGIKILAGLQSIDQIYANYGEERGRVIASGFMNCFCFQTPDANSRRYISERFGKNCYQLTYRSDNSYQSIQKDGYAFEDWDILNLPVGQAAVDLTGEKPFLFQFRDFESRNAPL